MLGSPALQRKTQCDGAGPASAASLSLPTASRSDTGARLSSPGEVKNIVEGGESRVCAYVCVWLRCALETYAYFTAMVWHFGKYIYSPRVT